MLVPVVPPYRPGREAEAEMSRRQRLVALSIVLVLAAGGLAAGGWALFAQGTSGNPTNGCVRVVLPSSIGGRTEEHCGSAARAWCAAEAHASGPLAARARLACREAGVA